MNARAAGTSGRNPALAEMAFPGAAGCPFGWLRKGAGGESATPQPGKVDRWREVVSHTQFEATPTATDPHPVRSARTGEAAEGAGRAAGLPGELPPAGCPDSALGLEGSRRGWGQIHPAAGPRPFGRLSQSSSAACRAPRAGCTAAPTKPAAQSAASGAERRTLPSFPQI